jgi:hypothetical protein
MNLKKIFSTPYPYIFLISYFGVLMGWNFIKIPAHSPPGIISHLTVEHYNPADNILRFLFAVFVPPLACLGYWWVTRNQIQIAKRKYLKKILLVSIAALSIFLALAMGMVQNSTNPANNPSDPYGNHENYLVDTFHEGETLGPAVSYQQKNLKPYTNFVVIHGVAQDPLRSVMAFKLFGRSIGAERTFTTILIMLAFVVYYLLLLVLFRGNLLKAAAGMVIMAFFVLPGGTIPFIQQKIVGVQLPFRDIATMAFIAFSVLSLRSSVAGKNSRLLSLYTIFAGLITTASYAMSVDRAIYITTLAIVLILMQWLVLSKRWLTEILLPFVAGLIIGSIVLLIALKGDVGGLVHYLTTISRYKDYLDGEEFYRPSVANSTVLLALSLSVAIAGAWLVGQLSSMRASGKGKYSDYRRIVQNMVIIYHTEILLGLTAILFMRSAIGRADVGHFIYSVQWLYLFLAYVSINYLFSNKIKLAGLMSYTTVILLIFISVFYAGQLNKINIRRDVFPVNVKDSELVRPDYLQTSNYLKQNLHGQETFVTLTSEGIWYYLVDKPSPIKYPIIWYAFTSEERSSIADSLDKNPHIKYIVTNNNWTSNFDYVSNPERFPEVYKILYSKYHPLTGFGQQTIWERN